MFLLVTDVSQPDVKFNDMVTLVLNKE